MIASKWVANALTASRTAAATGEADSGDMHVLLSRVSSDPNDVGEDDGLRGVMTQVARKHRDV
jgi:hypothetical protein